MAELHIIKYNFRTELEHGMYVCRLARDVAAELGHGAKLQRAVSNAGLLHDIGKLALNRYVNGDENDPLVIEQMKYVRLHASLSYEIAKEHGYPEDVLAMIRSHHENYDGTGYPAGLAGEEIPLGARILRVCDVFAALTTERPYRDRFPVSTALELMIEEIGHFDMEIFLAFQRVVHRVGTAYYQRLAAEFFTEEEMTDIAERLTKEAKNREWMADQAKTEGERIG